LENAYPKIGGGNCTWGTTQATIFQHALVVLLKNCTPSVQTCRDMPATFCKKAGKHRTHQNPKTNGKVYLCRSRWGSSKQHSTFSGIGVKGMQLLAMWKDKKQRPTPKTFSLKWGDARGGGGVRKTRKRVGSNRSPSTMQKTQLNARTITPCVLSQGNNDSGGVKQNAGFVVNR